MQATRRTPEEAAKLAAQIFRERLVWLRKRRRISQEELAAAVKRRGGSLSQKSVSNLENLSHDSTLASYAQAADELGVPVWVMLIPELDYALLEGEPLKRLTTLVKDYLGCTDEQRVFVEKMAAGYAGLARARLP